jgi:histidyl-tRNA synthetase
LGPPGVPDSLVLTHKDRPLREVHVLPPELQDGAQSELRRERGDYVIKVNNRKVLDGVMEAIGLGGEENAGRRLGVLRAIDKKDKIGLDGVQMLLGSEGRKDESGDFTRGVGLKISQVDDIVSYLIHPDWLPSSDLYAQGIGEMMEFEEICRQGGYNTDRILVARDVVRGLEYYTGPVFEAELTFPVTNEDGQVVRFGSVAGGGRYDGLVGRFRNDPVPATGFSIGVSRLYTALKLTNSPLLAGMAKPGPVVVTVMDKDRVSDYQRMVSELRGAGIAAELYLGSSGFNAQMKYADKRRSPCVVIQGTDEKAAGTVQVKDLILGAELAKLGREGKDREDYLERQKDAQFAVPEQRLVEAVKQVLARHG